MINFLWPFAFLALPVPFLVRYGLKPLAQSANGALRVPFFAQLRGQGSAGGRKPLRDWLRLAVAAAIWILLVTALARPALIGPPCHYPPRAATS